MSNLDSAIRYIPKLEQLPLILAGPILRHTQADEVTVWLALQKPATITLKIYATESGRGSILDKILLTGKRQTVFLGKNLHIVAITATPIGNNLLQPEQIYAYDLNIACEDKEVSLTKAIQSSNPVIPEVNYSTQDSKVRLGIAHASRSQLEIEFNSLSYFPHQLPTFTLPPTDLDQLKIVHGSCRKPHGSGRDALACLDNLIQDAASLANQRPHQLFLTGDQIYGDDVADPLLWLAQGVNQLLFGWSETLPCQQGTINSDELPPGKRTEFARIEGGVTAMLHGKADKAKSHLFSFGEYAAVYLLSWSTVFIPSSIPVDYSWFKNRQQSKTWKQESQEIDNFFQDLTAVRRALANVPVYTICDDHDISDDWYLNREWCDRVLGKPLGKRIVQNGLLAYSIFQAWGNTPKYFAPGTGGDKLLQLASRWLQSQGEDLTAKAKCDRYLGIPNNDTTTGLPQLQPDQDVLILAQDQESIPWYYTVYGSKHEVIILDTRTWRGYHPQRDKKLEPPRLLSPSAFQKQLAIPLQNKPADIEATILVLPTNLVTLNIIDRIQEYELKRNRVYSSDVGDSWNFNQEAFITLLNHLCQQRERVIILSGDIHYSCAVRLMHWDQNSGKSSTIVQLTSSAIKNSELATRIIHTKLKSLLPETTERWIGWHNSPNPVKLPQPRWWGIKRLKQQYPLPDWQYHIEWSKRQPAQSLPWKILPGKTGEKLNIWRKLIKLLVGWLWRNRWLQEGSEVIGKNNLSMIKLSWSTTKAVIQETHWYPPWNDTGMVKSCYEILLKSLSD